MIANSTDGSSKLIQKKEHLMLKRNSIILAVYLMDIIYWGAITGLFFIGFDYIFRAELSIPGALISGFIVSWFWDAAKAKWLVHSNTVPTDLTQFKWSDNLPHKNR